MYIKDIVKIFENKYPKSLAYNWDNVGLIIGNEMDSVSKIMLTLEATQAVIDEAVENKVDLIITHHPFIFKGLKKINTSTTKGTDIYKLIRNKISVYSAHTNFDIAYDGLNDEIAKRLDLKDVLVLDTTYDQKLYKIAVYVPVSHQECIRKTMADMGCGNIGNYSDCSFTFEGVGRFKPLNESNPYIGIKNEIETVEEVKIESICEESKLSEAINNIIKAHPYEEVAYDIYELKNKGKKYGLGRIGQLKNSMKFKELSEIVKKSLNINEIRVTGNLEDDVNKIAIVSGSGSEFINNAYNMGADVLITGDVKYHDAQNALELGIKVIDAGHFGSENIFSDIVEEYLQNKFENIEVLKSKSNINPFVTI
ncbi:Nif3-like dinuclear metal center hexameric protein [Tepidibacter hydrothermalis]|uniref:GTP cyclohydrolase 1 type 2 homolog n=1 Tax=Tepidibacter hydrothermalis TaxID=3036126 RepID=A0ABY8EL60_9FIRM|nr:Nif3-like dinuclear metal center hexameric protein [Tepidibacter hydrothermalis]WFD12105.1 Nif3-like dinuclear metal center hexameric protein [Tepidibacter hydrothermalis]